MKTQLSVLGCSLYSWISSKVLH